jgi:disulfide bond formation protein DsbB
MKILLPIVVIFAITVPIALLILKSMGVYIDIGSTAQSVVACIGGAMIVVGILGMIISAAFTERKERIYQGAFCTLLGISIYTYNLAAFLSAIALVAWMDFKDRSLK